MLSAHAVCARVSVCTRLIWIFVVYCIFFCALLHYALILLPIVLHVFSTYLLCIIFFLFADILFNNSYRACLEASVFVCVCGFVPLVPCLLFSLIFSLSRSLCVTLLAIYTPLFSTRHTVQYRYSRSWTCDVPPPPHPIGRVPTVIPKHYNSNCLLDEKEPRREK